MLQRGVWDWMPTTTRADGFLATSDFRGLLDQVTRVVARAGAG